jgi:predicted transposase/invertase (TIGR01784 family)
MTKSEQDMYDQDLKRKWDNDLAAASSREKGKAEGKIEGKLEVASKMKAEGFSHELITKCTGLSIEEIERL